jgi:hypothetical protein
MRKEIFLAIIVGIIVGLGITYGVYTLRQRFLPNKTAQEIANSRGQNPTPTPGTQQKTLTISRPENNLLTDQPEVKIVGRSAANSYITILAPSGEYITVADQDGDFAQDIELELGGNRLTVITILPDGQQEEIVLSVVYSTVDLNITDEATPEAQEGETQ